MSSTHSYSNAFVGHRVFHIELKHRGQNPPLVCKTANKEVGMPESKINRLLVLDSVPIQILTDALNQFETDPGLSQLGALDILRAGWASERCQNKRTHVVDFVID